MSTRSQSEDSLDSSSTSERILSSGKKDNNSDSGFLMERVVDLEKKDNLDGADSQLEENEEVKEPHCEAEKAECNQYIEVSGGSGQGAGKGNAKETWVEVLVDHHPTQSLAQTDSTPDLGLHSKNTFSEKEVEANTKCGSSEKGS
ncbi:hypothetical protein V6N13_091037 [Hibiscus sabdariffa]|uniref:Uncharacterized protein n=1 Tax=Hibiscus sabdariffa TaxID=183260 RepID=A0ABR2R2N9_9ROSI